MTALIHPRAPNGQFAPVDRMAFLRRYFSDAAFRARCDAERDREQESRSIQLDRTILAAYDPSKYDCEPGWLSVLRDRIADWEAANPAILAEGIL